MTACSSRCDCRGPSVRLQGTTMRRDLRGSEYNLTDAELESLDAGGLEAHAKRFVFGLGRAARIQIRPRHFEGTPHERMTHLARAVLASEKSPPDIVLGSA